MAEGKILVVALLLVIIFLGITAFLFHLEKRIRASEMKLKNLEEERSKDKEK